MLKLSEQHNFQKLIDKANTTTMYGLPIRSFTEDELRYVIGYLLEDAVALNKQLSNVLKRCLDN